VGGRGYNQFFRHENSSLCAAPAEPEPPFCVFPDRPGTSPCVEPAGPEPLDGIAAASLSSPARTNSLPRNERGYVGDTCGEMPLRTKPEGWIPDAPGSVTTTHFLLPSRLVRCRERQTADDAVLTLIFLIPNRRGLGKVQAVRSALANRSVDEPANPDIHHQTNRQENKQSG
jgi:hypothetical protein